MREDYVKYKLWEAVGSLAASSASIQRRLSNARVTLATSTPEDFSDPEARKRFAAMKAALGAAPMEGPEQTPSLRLSDDEAEEIARQIVELDTERRPLEPEDDATPARPSGREATYVVSGDLSTPDEPEGELPAIAVEGATRAEAIGNALAAWEADPEVNLAGLWEVRIEIGDA